MHEANAMIKRKKREMQDNFKIFFILNHSPYKRNKRWKSYDLVYYIISKGRFLVKKKECRQRTLFGKRSRKNFLIFFKKGIDKGEKVWYNSQAVAESGSERSLKIEQQERSTKHKKMRVCRSRQRVIYTQQSKRS